MWTKYIEMIKTSLNLAENNQSNSDPEIPNKIEGYCGAKTRHFYNNLLSYTCHRKTKGSDDFEEIFYLEIGTWKGSSVCGAMTKNKAVVVCVDNFSELGGPRNEFLYNFQQYQGENRAYFIEKDCFLLKQEDFDFLNSKFNIYIYDGSHAKIDHYNSLVKMYDFVDSTFIFIVDDWNWDFVRDGTNEAIAELGCKIHYQKEIFTTNDNSTNQDKNGWWNGICIFVLEK